MVLGPQDDRPHGGPRKQLNSLAKLSAVGIEFAISTVIGMLGGRWLDEKLGTPPWLMLLGLVIGVTAGLRSLIRTARQANQANQATDATATSEPRPPDDPSHTPPE